NTMVFTHLPSNILLCFVPLMPTFHLAVAMLMLRHLLSQMDVPTRQAYTMALVAPDERSAAAGITASVRSVAQAVSPAMSGAVMALAVFGWRFIIAGTLKSVYDVAIWLVFRKVEINDG
ncbi:MAG: MFS transporter, partial [Armatimonadetes bacterium]|nr:MFS transporter [Armatimonadota bacterium]